MNTQEQEVSPRAETAPSAAPPNQPLRSRSPRVDVIETPDGYHLAADLPGVPMNAIELTVEENRLELRAKRTPAVYDGHTPAVRQFGEGEFLRAFSLPQEIDRAAIHADLRDGVLRIEIPKAKPVEPQKVTIQVG